MHRSVLLSLALSAVVLLAGLATPATATRDRDERDFPSSVDYIVLGLGTSGSVVASRLASAKNRNGRFAYDVLGIDIGTDLTGAQITNDPGNWATVKGSEADWDISTDLAEPFAKLSNLDKRHVTQGRTLGGSSAINSAMFVRGAAEDYNRWGQANPGWSYNDVLPFFKSLENNPVRAAQSPAFHGTTGRLNMTANVFTPRLQPYIDAANNVGMTYNPDFNSDHLITSGRGSVGRIDVTIINGIRQNAYQSFLRPLVGQDNLYIADQSYVLKVNIKDGVAKSVDWVDLRTNEAHTTRARKEIILSLGALRSSQILRLSGVGEAAELASLNIPLVHNLPGVGKNLQDHPIATMAAISNNVPACGSQGPDPRVDLFIRTDLREAVDTRPDIEVIGSNGCNFNFALIYLLTPKSRGVVKLTSSDPTARPVPLMNYFSDPEGHDMATIAEGFRRTKQFFEAAPLSGFTVMGPADYTDATIADYVLGTTSGTANTNSGNHLVGSCKMGPASDPMAVVDHRLRVHGVQRLRVVDNSIMPEITSGNTQAPAYLIGEKGASMILADD